MIIRRYSTTSAPDMGPWLIQTSLEPRPHVRRLPRPPPLKAVGSLLVRCGQSPPPCLLPACSLLARGCRPRSGAHAFGLQASQGCTPFRSDGVQCLAALKHCTPSDLHYAAALLRFRPHFCAPSVG
mgnify:CR=1 FL=1